MSAEKRGRKKASINEIDAQIIELQKRRKELQAKQAERLGRIAMAAGISDLEVSDDDLMKAFEGVAKSFMERFQPEAGTHAAASPKAAVEPSVQA